ncbi:hypothetical protein ELI44_37230 [Rhizobium ruizarguesonis]|nr:hypothetical protein ELI42_37195 [Rhizobium ruizarguesonis]TAU45869.1 hypothetical protein ELI44_37230 [Rhizobium ruizarguesonis]
MWASPDERSGIGFRICYHHAIGILRFSIQVGACLPDPKDDQIPLDAAAGKPLGSSEGAAQESAAEPSYPKAVGDGGAEANDGPGGGEGGGGQGGGKGGDGTSPETNGLTMKGLSEALTRVGGFAGLFGLLGLLAAAFCLWFAAVDPVEFADKSEPDCRKDPSIIQALKSTGPANVKSKARDEAGELRIVEVWPRMADINGHLCTVVAGAASLSAENELDNQAISLKEAFDDAMVTYTKARNTPNEAEALAALQKARSDRDVAFAAAAAPPPPVDMQVYLDGQKAPFPAVVARRQASPQLIRFQLKAPDDYNADGAEFWRNLFAGVGISWSMDKIGRKDLVLGLSRSAEATTIPDANADDQPVTIAVFGADALLAGLMAMLFFTISFFLFARRTTILRENRLTVGARRAMLDEALKSEQAAGIGGPASPGKAAKDAFDAKYANYSDHDAIGPYSLGVTQMAVWFFLVVAAFLFITMTIGQFRNLLTEDILILLGISGVTGLASFQINAANVREEMVSNGFVTDILSTSANGAPQLQLQRLQAVAWTLILGGIFLWIAFTGFRFTKFDTSLLLLMGIAQSLYIGFKLQDAQAKNSL